MNQNSLYKWLIGGVGCLVIIGLGVAFSLTRNDDNGNGNGNGTEVVEKGDTIGGQNGNSKEDPIVGIEFTFPQGRVIKMENTTAIIGRGMYKDWGVKGAVDFVVTPEFNITTAIESNDGTKIIALVTLDRSRLSDFHFDNPDVRIELGDRFHMLADIGSVVASVLSGGGTSTVWAPGTTRLGEVAANQFLQQAGPIIRGPLESVAKSKVSLDKLDGTSLRITYVNGIGTQSIQIVSFGEGYNPAEHPVSQEEIRELFPRINNLFALFSRLFPTESGYPGAEWTVNAADLPYAWPAIHNLQVTAQGEMRLRRVESQDEDKPSTARVEIPEGQSGYQLTFTRGSDRHRMEGRAQLRDPQGYFLFDTEKKTVREIVTDGELDAREKSSAHWLFEANHQVNPRVMTRFTAEVDDSRVKPAS